MNELRAWYRTYVSELSHAIILGGLKRAPIIETLDFYYTFDNLHNRERNAKTKYPYAEKFTL